MHLRRQLLDQKEKERFISVSALRQLVVESSVRECLRIRGIVLESHALSTIVSKASKLFSILVLMGCEYHIEDWIAEDISDDIFPIVDQNQVPSHFEVDEDRRTFFRYQWAFPPVFNAQDHMNFPRDTVLPFLEREHVNNGTFGLIYRVRVADGHLAGVEEVSIQFIPLRGKFSDIGRPT